MHHDRRQDDQGEPRQKTDQRMNLALVLYGRDLAWVNQSHDVSLPLYDGLMARRLPKTSMPRITIIREGSFTTS